MRYLPVFLALVILGCALEPPHDEPLVPLAQYPGWYAEVEACSGKVGDYSQLRFWGLESDKLAGQTWGRDIFLVGVWAGNRRVVEHEMLHSLIGDGGHLSVLWWICGLHPSQMQ
jgi:hypothetical protein